MNKNTRRKSTAIVSLVLVPMNLLGLGFVGGCDNSSDSNVSSDPTYQSADAGGEPGYVAAGLSDPAAAADLDFADPEDPFNLDPVTLTYGPIPTPLVYPTTQPVAASNFANQRPHSASSYSHHYYHRSGGMMFLPVPIPFRSGYTPPYRPVYRPSYASPSAGFSYARPSTTPPPARQTYTRSSPGVGSNTGSSSVSRGGFGSSGRSTASSSSGS
jgi:hypothetical protein